MVDDGVQRQRTQTHRLATEETMRYTERDTYEARISRMQGALQKKKTRTKRKTSLKKCRTKREKK